MPGRLRIGVSWKGQMRIVVIRITSSFVEESGVFPILLFPANSHEFHFNNDWPSLDWGVASKVKGQRSIPGKGYFEPNMATLRFLIHTDLFRVALNSAARYSYSCSAFGICWSGGSQPINRLINQLIWSRGSVPPRRHSRSSFFVVATLELCFQAYLSWNLITYLATRSRQTELFEDKFRINQHQCLSRYFQWFDLLCFKKFYSRNQMLSFIWNKTW